MRDTFTMSGSLSLYVVTYIVYIRLAKVALKNLGGLKRGVPFLCYLCCLYQKEQMT